MQIERFFDELAPRLETARVLDEELDRNLARRFNVLDYLRTDELGLSRIIADLLDPKGSHGQGVQFLRAFLKKLQCSGKGPEWPDLKSSGISVFPEKWTEGRPIDLVVEIEGPDGATCLAFENKPYALDQESQVRDYLGSLKRLYPGGFLLIYLPPRGEGPSKSSIRKDELAKWKNHFAIMPYVDRHEEWGDGFDEYRLKGHALADWLGECRKNCEVERLRWFLRDMEAFCQRRFGGQVMTTDFEAKAVADYVLLDSDRLRTAQAVYESWPEITKRVCRRFLERLCSAIDLKARKIGFGDDIRITPVIEEDNKNWMILLYREAWVPYKGKEEEGAMYNRCTTICLQNLEKDLNGWLIGVASPVPKTEMKGKDKQRREKLESALGHTGALGISPEDNTWWPWCERVDEKRGTWGSLVPELQREIGAPDQGEITQYYVHRLIEVAEKAIPRIDAIEGSGA